MKENTGSIREMIAKDKRKFERLDLEIRTYYSLTSAGNDPSKIDEWVGPFSIENISGNGMSFAITENLSKGTRLYFKILVPKNDKPMYFTGTIVWQEKNALVATNETKETFLIGIQFDKIQDEFQQDFITYISDNILSKYLDA